MNVFQRLKVKVRNIFEFGKAWPCLSNLPLACLVSFRHVSWMAAYILAGLKLLKSNNQMYINII